MKDALHVLSGHKLPGPARPIKTKTKVSVFFFFDLYICVKLTENGFTDKKIKCNRIPD